MLNSLTVLGSTRNSRVCGFATIVGVALAGLSAVQGAETSENEVKQPNVVIIFIDDMGYGDIGPFGATDYATPNLDRMSKGGRKFTDFHSATAVCSAARAALLTGCYPERVSILGALGPRAKHGLHQEELTLAELCKQQGYATACFGKWHLGHLPEHLPLQHGFDEYYGLPYSNDMWPYRPGFENFPREAAKRRNAYPELPLIEGNQVIDAEISPEDQRQLTTDYTKRAVDFIFRKKDQPFFLYMPHSMVHVPLYVSDKFQGKSGAGLFGDVVMEIDWSVGEILNALKENGLEQNTLVVFTSDNGPWLNFGNHAGSAGPLREGKGTMFEGGYREPCVMHWPGIVPAGTTCDEFCTTMDLLPTIASLMGAELPQDRVIDGKDVWPLISGATGAESPHKEFYCYYNNELRAVRDRRWKLHLPHKYRTMGDKSPGRDGVPKPYHQEKIGLALFDLTNDIGETTNVAQEHPDVVARLQAAAERAREDLGDRLTKRQGGGVRPHGSASKTTTRNSH